MLTPLSDNGMPEGVRSESDEHASVGKPDREALDAQFGRGEHCAGAYVEAQAMRRAAHDAAADTAACERRALVRATVLDRENLLLDPEQRQVASLHAGGARSACRDVFQCADIDV